MDLIPATAGPGASEPGQVLLSERAKRLAKLTTAEVVRQSGSTSDLRLLGVVEPAETARHAVTSWVGGRLERLQVKATGETVRRGQVVASLYSPEVYSAHQDLITARRQAERLGADRGPAGEAARAALEASRQRLRLIGVPEETLRGLEEAEEPARSVSIRSPYAGTVLQRLVTEGAYVEVGSPLFDVADLSTVWVQLDAYESDLPRLRQDQAVELTLSALPGQRFEGVVAFLDPTLDPSRRTARVRVVVPNPEGLLRPGLFAEARVSAGPADASSPLVIPASAPLFTGRRSLVYVELERPEGAVYEPRVVRLGPRLGEVYPVVSGLSEGERVVSRGAFVLDSDLQIRGGPSMMTRGDDREAPGDPVIPLAQADRARFRPVLAAYLEVQTALAADDLSQAKAHAAQLLAALGEVLAPKPAEAAWTDLAPELRRHALTLSGAGDLEEARGAFEPLTAAAVALLSQLGNPLEAPVRLAYCPMAKDNAGARWLQLGERVDNAYFGASMRQCGEIEGVVDPGTYLDAEPRR
jgi:Cu(I)/Ag(I) efflux system membrane fusion protein